MRIVFWVSLFLLATGVAAGADRKLELPSGKTLAYSASDGCTKLVLPVHSRKSEICLHRDDTVANNAQVSIKLIAELPNALILTDTYPSIPGGMSYCQAGEEVFLRVISLKGKHARETYHRKLSSCRGNLELADPGVTWTAQSQSLTLNWLASPEHQGSPRTQTLIVRKSGEVKSQ